MITEDDLRRLLADAADSVPPPGRAPEALLATLTEPVPVKPARRRPSRLGATVVAAAAAVLAVVLVGAALQRDENRNASFQETGAAIGGGGGSSSDGANELDEQTADLGSDTFGYDDGLHSTASGATPGAAASPEQPADTAKVIRTGSLDLEVRKGAFEGTVSRITSQVVGLGGYIAESTTSEGGDAPSGSIVVRVPDESFDQLLSDVRELGEVKAVTSKGTDVTAQYTDLEARLTALEATRDRLGTVLSEAANVPDILAVQDRITQVQVEIEQIQGQQRLLDDQTAMGTLSVTVGEPGAEIVHASTPNDGLGSAWDDARRRFGDGLEGIVSWSGAAAVVLIVGLLLLALTRVVWVGARRRLV